MSFEKPAALLAHDPVFLAIFIIAIAAILWVQKWVSIPVNTLTLYILFFVLLVGYIMIRRIYE